MLQTHVVTHKQMHKVDIFNSVFLFILGLLSNYYYLYVVTRIFDIKFSGQQTEFMAFILHDEEK